MTMRVTRRQLLAGASTLLAAPAMSQAARARSRRPRSPWPRRRAGQPTQRRRRGVRKTGRREDRRRGYRQHRGLEQLGNDVAMLTSLRTGALDLTANSQGAASGLVPELAALGLPFLFEDADAAFKVWRDRSGRS